jgi:hypothetical protein
MDTPMALELRGNTDPGIPDALPTDKRWELVQRIVRSSLFRRSARLRELLLYLCRRAIQEASPDIHEHEVGAAVFNRTPDYDSSGDPIVRVQASQLRKKLLQYFDSEGIHEELLLEIPKGAYTPVFRHRLQPTSERPATQEPSAPNAKPRKIVSILAGLCLILATALVWLVMWDMRRQPQPTALDSGPALQALWSQLIIPGRLTSVVLADACLSLLQNAARQPITLEEYLRRDFGRLLDATPKDDRMRAFVNMVAARQYTSIADVDVARRILRRDPSQSHISIVFARNFDVRSANRDNLVLVGSQRSNPWVGLFEKGLNFQFDYEEDARRTTIRNRSPRSGENETYRIRGEGSAIREGYATVAFLPNLGGSGNVLILAGTDMAATEAAGRFVTTESQLAPFFRSISTALPDKLPCFEVLLQTRQLGGAPVECNVLIWRLPSRPSN